MQLEAKEAILKQKEIYVIKMPGMRPEIGDYQNLQGFRLFSKDCELVIQSDEKRRCYRMQQKNTVVNGQVNSDLIFLFKETLREKEKKGYYFEDVNRPFPKTSYCLLDARALLRLAQEHLIIAVSKENKDKISLVTTSDILGQKEYLFQVKTADLPTNCQDLTGAREQLAVRKCRLKQDMFKKRSVVLNQAMSEFLSNNYADGQSGNILLIYGHKCKITQDGQEIILNQLDKDNKIIPVSQEFFVFFNLMQTEQAYIKDSPHDENKTRFNFSFWQGNHTYRKEWRGDFFDKVKGLRGHEQKEAQAIRDIFPQINQRIWRKGKRYKTCIDSQNEIFLSVDDQNIEAFREYFQGSAYMRRKQSFAVPIVPVIKRRTFARKGADEEGFSVVIDGPDDVAMITNNTNYPGARDLFFQLAVFSFFLTLIKLGLGALDNERQDANDELNHLRECLKEAESHIGHIITKAQDGVDNVTQHDVLELFSAMEQMRTSLEQLKVASLHASASAYFGYPAMLLMFSSVSCYQLSTVINLCSGGYHPVNEIRGSVSAHGFAPGGGDNAVFMAGSSLALVGQTLMSIYAMTKIYAASKEIKSHNKHIAEIKASEELSEYAKIIIIAIKKDLKLFHKFEMVGNGFLATGQIAMAASGPTAGLCGGVAFTVLGVVSNIVTSFAKNKRYTSREVDCQISKKILNYYDDKIANDILQMKPYDDAIQTIKEKITAYEVIMHLSSARLVIDKILRERGTTNDLERARMKSARHYRSRDYQDGLFRLSSNIGPKNTKLLKTLRVDKEVDVIAVRLYAREVLSLKEHHFALVQALAQKLVSVQNTKTNTNISIGGFAPAWQEFFASENRADLIRDMQNIFIHTSLQGSATDNVATRLAHIQRLDSQSEKIKFLVDKMFSTEVESDVREKLLKVSHQHKRDNLEELGYVKKSGGTGLLQRSHKKTIYRLKEDLNTDEMPTVQQLDKLMMCLKTHDRACVHESMRCMEIAQVGEQGYGKLQSFVAHHQQREEIDELKSGSQAI